MTNTQAFLLITPAIKCYSLNRSQCDPFLPQYLSLFRSTSQKISQQVNWLLLIINTSKNNLKRRRLHVETVLSSAAELRYFFLFIAFQRRNSTVPVTTSGFFIKSKAAGFQPEPTLNMQLICTEILKKETKKTYYCLNSPTF